MIKQGKVLFVDDEKRVLNSMRGLFRRDYELFLTTDGSEAIKLVAEHDIDVIVADQRMPGLTGVQVLGEIREVSPRTVRILLTGYADPEAIEGSINIGEVFRFLSKPCQPKLLKETLKLAISASRATASAVAANTPATAASPAADTPPAAPPASEPAPAADQTLIGEASNVTPISAAKPADGQDSSSSADNSGVTHWQNRTEIVMSGDTSEEVGPTESGQQSDTSLSDVGVAVFTVNPNFAESAIRTISADRSALVATTLVKVAEILEERAAGVLVTDFTSDIGLLQNMIGTLKQHMPELVTIVVSESRDTSDMINLINYGQVFRYVEKPIDPQTMRTDVNAAALKHLQLLEYPELVQRHQVVNLSTAAKAASPTLDQFIGKVTELRGRWTNTNDKSH